MPSGKGFSRRSFQFACGGFLLPRLLAQTPATGTRRVVPLDGNPAANQNAPAASLSPSGSGRRVALVIGNNAYKKAPPLGNAGNDAEDLGDRLTKLGFTVTKVRDAGVAPLRKAIAGFVASLAAGDSALLFYSGHGIQANGENYIVPVDFDPATGEAGLAAGCVAASGVRESIEKSGSRLNVLILDSCRDNPFRPGSPVKGMAVMEAGLGTFVALATGPGQTASDNPGERNGLFSKYLIKQIGRPGEPIDLLFKNVKEQVFGASNGMQRPWVFADLIGDFYFGAATGAASAAVSSGQAGQLVETGKKQFQAGQFEEAAASFDRALRADPENAFTYNALGSARARLKQSSVAVGLFAKAIELKPDYTAAYFNRGVAYYNAARYELALQDFSWAVDGEPYDPLVLDLRGKTYLAMRDVEPALADFTRALELNPSDATALAGRGKGLFRQGHYDDAIKDLTASIGIAPAAETYDTRASSYRGLHKDALADADVRRAEQLRAR